MKKPTSTTLQTIRLYWSHVRRYPVYTAFAFISLPLAVLTGTFLPPLVLANILNRLSEHDYITGQIWTSFGRQLLLYAILLLVSMILWRLNDGATWRLEGRVLRSLARRVFGHLMNQSADFHANSFSGSLVSQTNRLTGAYVRVADTTIYQVMPLIWGIIFTSVFLYGRAPFFVLSLLGLALVYILVTIVVTKPNRKQSGEYAAAESRQTGYLADSVSNVMAVKSFAGTTYEGSRFAKVTEETRKALMRYAHTNQVQLVYFASFNRIFQMVAIVSAIIGVMVYQMNIATVFLVLTFTSTIAEQLFNFSNGAVKNYNRSFGDAKEMTQILAQTPEILDPATPEKSRMHTGAINFNAVTFTHSGNNDALFSGLDLNIKPGEKVGLVGHSGSGKTTFTRLLLRFSDVDNGTISIDGQDIRQVTQDDLHKSIAYVPQEPLMFHRSLTDNIRYGNFSANQKDIEKVAKLAHAHEFIKDLPLGYDTLVGERGVKLSGGQRQRVAIARAMIKDAPILVLDEATSALDSESEVLIQDALWKLMEGRTAIVIAHRLSTIQRMDRIVVMDNGRIVEEGSHKELIAAKGTYADLWNHQSGGFIDD